MLGLGNNLTGGNVLEPTRDVTNNYSVYYDGTDSTATGTIPALGDTFSISMWINFASLPTTGNGYDNLISFGAKHASNPNLFLIGRYDESGTGQTIHVWDGSRTYYVASHTVSTSTWYHYVCVVAPVAGGSADADRLQFYVNNVSKTIVDSSSNAPDRNWDINATSSGTIAKYHKSDVSHANAYFDEVAIYDIALTADDVADIHNGGKPSDLASSASYDTDRTGGLVRYWRFEENTGSTSANSAGTGTFNATLSDTGGWASTVPS